MNSTKLFFLFSFPAFSSLSLCLSFSPSLSLSSLPPSPSCCQQVHTESRAPYLLTTFTFMIPIGNGIQLVWITTLGHDWSLFLRSHSLPLSASSSLSPSLSLRLLLPVREKRQSPINQEKGNRRKNNGIPLTMTAIPATI